MRKSIALLTLLAALLANPLLAADTLTPGSNVVLEGKVTEVVSHDTFWLDRAGTRVLVYQSTFPRKALRVGQQLRVSGRVSDDWMRLTNFEVDAHQIENQGATLTAGAR